MKPPKITKTTHKTAFAADAKVENVIRRYYKCAAVILSCRIVMFITLSIPQNKSLFEVCWKTLWKNVINVCIVI